MKQIKKQKFTWKKVVIGFLGLVVVVGIGGALWLNHFTNSGLPVIEGELAVAGLNASVTVTRDKHGVAHIVAESDRDLFIAQGFVHAQDRLFQMDLGRRQASGRLAEVFGSMAIEQDRYFRTLRLRYYAIASAAVQSPETMAILEWYALGVNAFIDQAVANNNLPVEFRILGYQPEPWTIYDSLTFVKYKAYDLAGNWEGQAFRAYLLQNFSLEQALELFPSYPLDALYVINADVLDLGPLFEHVVLPDEHNGSNNWVVAGSRTASGAPMLADDPHLSLATPSIWYHNHLQGGSFNVNGVSVAGAPGVVLGHNDYIAWGVTNTGPDVQDLFIERRNPENPHQFLFDDQWLDAIVHHEVIYVDGGDPVEFEVVITRHGPIISELAGFEEQDYALALKWTAHQPTAELDALLGFNRATNWDEFHEAGRHLSSPTQSFVFAAVDGTIAFQVIGDIPIRANGRIPEVPVTGWTGEGQWLGTIPYEALPRVVNPEAGFVATANHKVVSAEYPFFITNEWAQPFRGQRIDDLLSANDNLTVADMIAIQVDNKNLEAAAFLPYMLIILEQLNLTEQLTTAVNHLQSWDYFDEVDAIGSTIFNVWMREIQTYLFEEAISPEMWPLFRRRSAFVNELFARNFNGETVIWIEASAGMEQLLETTLTATIDRLQDQLGNNIASWQWGNFHQVEFRHPLSSVSPLHLLFNPRGRLATPGSAVTVNAANFNASGLTNHGAGWRFVIDLVDITSSYMIVAPGNSGHPRSPFYQNNIDLWIAGELYQTSLHIPRNSHELRLVPAIP